jgi:hypothetical protein
MDDGHVIPGLNEEWSFAGAKLMEWMTGLTSAFLASTLIEKPATAMPLLVIILIGTTLSLSNLRKRFPDEERGVMNLVMTSLGFQPIGIPAPARLQPRWSGGRISKLPNRCLFVELDLDSIINNPEFDAQR